MKEENEFTEIEVGEKTLRFNRMPSQGNWNDRITIVTTFTHEQRGNQPVSFQSAGSVLLMTEDEEIHNRRYWATEEWQELDFGPFDPEQVGLLWIESLEGRGLTVNPTEEEKDIIRAKVIELSLGDNDNPILLYPQCFPERTSPGVYYGEVADPSKLRIRCRFEKARYRLVVTPK